MLGKDTVAVIVERRKLPHVVPKLVIGGVEDMRAVGMNLNHRFRITSGIGIAADMTFSAMRQERNWVM